MAIARFLTKVKSSKGWQSLDLQQRQRGQRDGNHSIFDKGKEVKRMAIAWFLTKAARLKGWQSLDFGADQRFVSIRNVRLLDS